jgi:catechol 2,3-dioxygenase-like lactoylglutathione lyase family enzyme
MSAPKAYLEHVAIWVKDIHWHIRFFEEVLGMTLREIDGTREAPRQYWTLGGLQFIHAPEFEGPEGPEGPEGLEGRLAHLGVMCEDLEAALSLAHGFGVSEMPQGRNWLRLPDGLAVELIQAKPASCVAQALAINPRAQA